MATKNTAQEITLSQGSLAIILSRLNSFFAPELREEQYPTNSQIAAEWLIHAAQLGDIQEKVIVDMGAGTGILGLGAILLGAKKVYLIEKDEAALKITKDNYEMLLQQLPSIEGKVKLIAKDIKAVQISKDFEETSVDTIIQNPPFGTKQKHADKEFLEKSMKMGRLVYSMHKITSKAFIKALCIDNNYSVTHLWEYDLPLKAVFKFHKNKIKRIRVGVWRLKRN